ncbi:hypothetical protein ACJRO7_002554 [Eucalyptus globulus]|uniref:Pentatricopeptide repeat-containing protein n=1 Tax=Eucalyptus globulus TaxID=34317 RepID=A0ABD3LVN9_EUCGL
MKITGGAKNFKRMRSLFHQMRRKGCWITPHMDHHDHAEMKAGGCDPSGSTCKLPIVSLCGRKGRKVDEAMKLFREVMKSGYFPDKEFVEIYLGCLSDKWEEALKLMNDAGAKREPLNKCTEHRPWATQKGNLEAALSKVDDMKQAGVSSSFQVYTSLAAHYVKEKEIEKPRKAANRLLLLIPRSFGAVGKVGDAWSAFNQMKSERPSPGFRTLLDLHELSEIGRSEEAWWLTSERSGDEIDPSGVDFRTVFYGLNREN